MDVFLSAKVDRLLADIDALDVLKTPPIQGLNKLAARTSYFQNRRISVGLFQEIDDYVSSAFKPPMLLFLDVIFEFVCFVHP
jgi:hypothetical protein